ncbi:hypothetical protein AB6A40_000449 [Gnathostoma spinigerum]|uniref:HTH CENPB-type domain-containing protein n=1 Tax=Gnathostoma spinigerum TaxID=75299 RepID=A0ABD6EBS7_9BILA
MMCPKRSLMNFASSQNGLSLKRPKRVMTLAQKIELLDMLASGVSATAAGRIYGVNESTVRYIKKKEREIREMMTKSTLSTAKVTRTARDPLIAQMEDFLFEWIEGRTRKGEALNSLLIREKAKHIYDSLLNGASLRTDSDSTHSTENTTSNDHSLGISMGTSSFHASKGWLENFKKRRCLSWLEFHSGLPCSAQVSGESSCSITPSNSATDGELAQMFLSKDYWLKLWERAIAGDEYISSDGTKEFCNTSTAWICNSPDKLRIDNDEVDFIEKNVAQKETADVTNKCGDYVGLIEKDDVVSSVTLQKSMSTESPTKMAFRNLTEIFQLNEQLCERLFRYDPLMERSLKCMREIEAALSPYRDMYESHLDQSQCQVSMVKRHRTPPYCLTSMRSTEHGSMLSHKPVESAKSQVKSLQSSEPYGFGRSRKL